MPDPDYQTIGLFGVAAQRGMSVSPQAMNVIGSRVIGGLTRRGSAGRHWSPVTYLPLIIYREFSVETIVCLCNQRTN